MNVKRIAAILVMLCLGCSLRKVDKDDDLSKRHIIAGSSFKYWMRVDKSHHEHLQYFDRFDNSGRWRVYVKGSNESFGKYRGGDAVLLERWRLIGMDSIDIGGGLFRILELSDSAFTFASSSDTSHLLFASDSLIPIDYRTDNPPDNSY